MYCKTKSPFMSASKHSAFFVEFSNMGFVIARTSGYSHPATVHEIHEIPADDAEGIRKLLERIGKPPRSAGYTRARCGVYPRNRLLGKIVVDEPRKAKDPRYLEERVRAEFSIDPSAYHLAVLNPRSGAAADIGNLMEKEFFLCGAPIEELAGAQRELLELGIFPDRLELGSVASLGALADYHRMMEIEHPTLVLEIGMNDTRVIVINRGTVDSAGVIPQGLRSMIEVVQRDLGLKHEGAAQRLFYSDSFDFKEMAPKLIDRLLRQLQSSVGFYEVQTGLSIGQVLCTRAPEQLSWLNKTFAKNLNVDPFSMNFPEWLRNNGIELGPDIDADALPPHWLGVFGLMADTRIPEDETK